MKRRFLRDLVDFLFSQGVSSAGVDLVLLPMFGLQSILPKQSPFLRFSDFV